MHYLLSTLSMYKLTLFDSSPSKLVVIGCLYYQRANPHQSPEDIHSSNKFWIYLWWPEADPMHPAKNSHFPQTLKSCRNAWTGQMPSARMWESMSFIDPVLTDHPATITRIFSFIFWKKIKLLKSIFKFVYFTIICLLHTVRDQAKLCAQLFLNSRLVLPQTNRVIELWLYMSLGTPCSFLLEVQIANKVIFK